MNHFNKYIHELAEKFTYIIKVVDDNGNKIIDKKEGNSENIVFDIDSHEGTYTITVGKEASSSVSLLKFILKEQIEKSLKEKHKENILYRLIEEEEFNNEEYEDIKKLSRGQSSIVIAKLSEIDRNTYLKLNKCLRGICYYCIRNKSIVIFNKFNNIEIDIKNLLSNLKKENIIIKKVVYDKEINSSDIKSRIKVLEYLCEKIDLNSVDKNIFTYQNAIFEILLKNTDKEVRNEILNQSKNYFDKMNNEMRNTIDTFFDKDLCISETSKSLYIHRNTLVYRLDKIKKDMLLDLRNFNDAINFYIIYRLWKIRN